VYYNSCVFVMKELQFWMELWSELWSGTMGWNRIYIPTRWNVCQPSKDGIDCFVRC
jgi:hypothetical protein